MLAESTTCPMGCLFHKGHLHGDCRAPWREDCELNRRDRADREREASCPTRDPREPEQA